MANDGCYDEGIHSLKLAVNVNSKDANIRYGLGLIYLLQENTAAAENEHKIIMSLDEKLGEKFEKHISEAKRTEYNVN